METTNQLPKWAAKRMGFNLSKEHQRMLNEIMGHLKKLDRRTTMTSILETAIAALHKQVTK